MNDQLTTPRVSALRHPATSLAACLGLALVAVLPAQTATPVSSSWRVHNLTVRRGGIPYLSALDLSPSQVGVELFTTDGTSAGPPPAGTYLVRDINIGGSGAPTSGVEYGAIALFDAREFVLGYELWRTDGTQAGTSLVLDISPGIGHSAPGFFFRMNNLAYFFATPSTFANRTLFATDGTTGGTTSIPNAQLTFNATNVAVVGNRAYYPAYHGPSNDHELYVTDGTAAGTMLAVETKVLGSSSPQELTPFGDKLLFTAETDFDGRELFVTDGTQAGTIQLTTLDVDAPRRIEVAGSIAFFQGNGITTGRELWRTDGTVAGTGMVKDIAPGSANGLFLDDPIGESLGNELIFRALSNGTAELWKSDGTAAGTVRVAGGFHPFPPFRRHGSRHVYYFGTWGLCRTDGTAAGTQVVARGLSKDSNSPLDRDSTLTNTYLLFTASVLGSSDYYRIDPGAYADPVGSGCASSGVPPALSSADPVVNTNALFQVSDAPPSTSAVLALGFATSPVALATSGIGASCALHYDSSSPAVVYVPFATDAAGAATIAPNITWTASLTGFVFAAQAAITDPSMPPIALALSNGVNLSVGN